MFADYLINSAVQRSDSTLGKTIALSLDGFEKMLTFNDVDRRFNNPWLVSACAERLQKHVGNASVKVTQIHVDRKSLLRLNAGNKQLVKVTDEELLQSDISTIVGSRAIIKIEVDDLYDDYHPALAISLSESGEEVAFGGSVDICSNLTILSQDRCFSTHKRHADRSKPRLTTKELLTQLDELFPQTEQVLENDLRLIEQLKAQPVSIHHWNAFVGGLFSQIHYVNRKRLNKQIASLPKEVKDLPITASLLANVVAEAIEPAHDVYRFIDGMSNVWNCINYGTEQVKAYHGVPPQQILPNNTKWAELVLKHDFQGN